MGGWFLPRCRRKTTTNYYGNSTWISSNSFRQVKGFNDPNGTYPQKENSLSGHALNESDVNRLARNDTDQAHAIVKTKDDARTTGVPIANTTDDTTDSTNEEWTEQASTYADFNLDISKNHVYETESGHIKEFDDTEGAERIHEYHKSGTFYEVDASGNKHTRIVGTNYEGDCWF